LRNETSPAKRAALLGILASVAIVLSIVENTLTGMANLAVPGIKPGLANLAVVLALYYLGGGYAAVIALVKAGAVFLATGAATTLLFSLAGSLLAAGGMWLLHTAGKGVFSLAGISALGGVLSNLGQILVMAAVSGTAEFFYYLPVLGVSGVLFGLAVGLLANLVTAKIKRESI